MDSFTRFAADAGLPAPYLRHRAMTLSRAVEATIGEGFVVPGLPRSTVTGLAAVTAERAARLALNAG